MTDFHGLMMNIQPPAASRIVGSVSAYATGHRDARHAAAEIALRADARIAELEAEVTELKSTVVSFCAPWAISYGQGCGLPPMHLHPTHYDILARCGARMDDFHRAEIEAPK